MIRVDVTDEDTGDTDSMYLEDGPDGYVLVCGPGCELTYTQVHANGTHVLTVKPLREATDAPICTALPQNVALPDPPPTCGKCRMCRLNKDTG